MFCDLVILVARCVHLERRKQLFLYVVYILPDLFEFEAFLWTIKGVFFFHVQEVQILGGIIRCFRPLVLPVIVNEGVSHYGEEPPL